MDNLLEMIGSQVSPDMVGQISGMLGEDSGATQKAVTAALPALLGGMVSKGSSEAGAGELLGMLSNPGAIGGGDLNPADLVGNLGGFLGGGDSNNQLMQMGGALLPMLMGDKAGGVGQLISQFSGVSADSSSGIMKMLAPLAMGVLAKKVMGGSGGGMDASALMGLLGGQSSFLKGAAIPGMGDVMGLGDLGKLGVASGLLGGVQNALGDAAGAAGNMAGSAAGAVGDAAGAVTGTAKNMAGSAAGAVGNATGAVTDTAKDVANVGQNAIARFAPMLIGALVVIGLIWFLFLR